jgi:SNF2 family DNA or RNA helicase
MDAKRTVSLEAFKSAHSGETAEADEEESEAEEDWSLDDDRKRKGKGKEPEHKVKSYKKSKVVMDEEEEWTSSAKIDKLCEILDDVRRKDPTEKVIVFSQFTGFLDLIGPALTTRNYNFGRVRFLMELAKVV